MEYGYAEYIPALKALADETRLKILDMLSCGELCACKILSQFSITQPTLSYHMKLLCDCGLVTARRDGAWMNYSICAERAKALTEYLGFITSPKTDCICNKEETCDE